MNRRRAFTVVEVMIFLLIVAFLLVLIIPAFQEFQRARAERNAPPAAQTAPRHP